MKHTYIHTQNLLYDYCVTVINKEINNLSSVLAYVYWKAIVNNLCALRLEEGWTGLRKVVVVVVVVAAELAGLERCGRGWAGSDDDEVGYGDGSCIKITSDEVPDLALCFNSFQHFQKLCLQSCFGQTKSTADISNVFTFF